MIDYGSENFGGVYVWEYFDAPPTKNPIDWAKKIYELRNNIGIMDNTIIDNRNIRCNILY